VNFDVVADLRKDSAFALTEFAHGDAAFGFQANVDDDDVFFDADNATVNDLAFAKIAALQLFAEQSGEIIASGVKGIGHMTLGVDGNGSLRTTASKSGAHAKGVKSLGRNRVDTRRANRRLESP